MENEFDNENQSPYSGYDSAASSWQYTPPKQEKKGITAGKVIAIALVCALLGGLIGAGAMFGLSGFLPNSILHTGSTTIFEGKRENVTVDIQEVDTDKLMTPAEVYAVNVGSTVGITTSITTNFWGYQTTSAAAGSGFILSADGYILTNFHVIEDSNAISVSMYDNTIYDAKLVGYDESNDIAVLKIDAKDLTPVTLGDSDNLNVGDTVLAIGNPLGELTFSLTTGVLSAKDRRVTLSSGVSMNLMQTDCAINSGNSGGALFNLYGEVIGITNAKYSSSSNSGASIDNIGFAIPINQVRDIVTDIIEDGYIKKPYIGITVDNVSEEAQRYGLPKGAAVITVSDGGPAQKAGLQVNDIITAMDGTEITSKDDLVARVGKCNAGDTVVLTVYRKGESIELSVTVGEQTKSAMEQMQQQGQQQQQQQDGYEFPFSFPFNFWN